MSEPMTSFISCFMKVMPFWLYLYYHHRLSTSNLGHILQIKIKAVSSLYCLQSQYNTRLFIGKCNEIIK